MSVGDFLVFARPEDGLGTAIHGELRSRGKAALLVTDVADLALTCRPSTATLKIANRVVDEPACVFFRQVPQVPVTEESREYAESEWRSALGTWLQTLRCPVYNRPLKAADERWRLTPVDVRRQSSATSALAVRYTSGEYSILSNSTFACVANRVAGLQELSKARSGEELLKNYDPDISEIWSCWVVLGRCVLAGRLEGEQIVHAAVPPPLAESIASRSNLDDFFGSTWWIRISGREDYLLWDIDHFPSAQLLTDHADRVAYALIESLQL